MRAALSLFLSLLLACALCAGAAADAQLDTALDYLREVAFGAEYGRKEDRLQKLMEPLRLYTEGYLTKQDEAFIDGFLHTLQEKVPQLQPQRVADKAAANTFVSYVPPDQMKERIPSYVEGNRGFFAVEDERNHVRRIDIAIATDISTQKERNHLFMEELFGALGLSTDSDRYPDSILYQEWTSTQTPSALDWLCLQLLYADYVQPGMSFPAFQAAVYAHQK